MNLAFFFGLAASCGDLLGSVGYIRAVVKGETRPHIFSWLVWAILAAIGTGIQIHAGSWGSALSFGVGGSISATIFLLGLRQGDHDLWRTDWFALIGALAAIPLWLLSDNALHAALLLSAINLMATMPTLRKAWMRPREENLGAFSLFTGVSVLRVLAVSPFSWAVALYPVAIAAYNAAVVVILLFKRSRLFSRG